MKKIITLKVNEINMNTKQLFSRMSLMLATLFILPYSSASAAEFCDDAFSIDQTLPNGARWDMCWEHRANEGIVYKKIHFTPVNGTRRMVLNHAAIAQIHVPYDDNGQRFHDVSDFGLGGENIQDLQADECPSGTLLRTNIVINTNTTVAKNVLCKQVKKRDFAYKSGTNTEQGYHLDVFSVSPVGSYYYIPTWRFMDDGTIEPRMGATGALQRFSFGGSDIRGWELGDGSIGLSHLHNFFWKLDFDLNGSHLDDVVEEINFSLENGKRTRNMVTLSSESARQVDPTTMRHWRVRDTATNSNGHNLSYDIFLNETGHRDIGPATEPFTFNDFFVTKQNDQEKFASHNVSGGLNLAEFVNGESIVNNDIVIWAGITFYHMPRSEDAPHMDAHWSHFRLVPRDWYASNPLIDPPVNTEPTIITPLNQTSVQGSLVNLAIQANDVDGDTLTYSATGLPNGLQINSSTGIISGIASNLSAGNFFVTISVSDGIATSNIQFNWLVTSSSTNNPPIINNPSAQANTVGENISLSIQANDIDNDALQYSATGLPAGLQINNISGLITGVPTTVSNNTVTVVVNDSQVSRSTTFIWNISAQNNGGSNSGGGGAFPSSFLLLLSLLVFTRRYSKQ